MPEKRNVQGIDLESSTMIEFGAMLGGEPKVLGVEEKRDVSMLKLMGVKKLEEGGEYAPYCTEDGNSTECDAVLKFDAFNASKEEMMGVMRGKGRSRLQMLHDAVVGMVDAGVSCEEIVSRLNGVADQEEIEKVYEIVKHEKSEK